MAAHKTYIDHVGADRLDTAAWSAYCEDCDFQGDWHHPDSFPGVPQQGISQQDQAIAQAIADGQEHTRESAED